MGGSPGWVYKGASPLSPFTYPDMQRRFRAPETAYVNGAGRVSVCGPGSRAPARGRFKSFFLPGRINFYILLSYYYIVIVLNTCMYKDTRSIRTRGPRGSLAV